MFLKNILSVDLTGASSPDLLPGRNNQYDGSGTEDIGSADDEDTLDYAVLEPDGSAGNTNFVALF